MKKSNLIKKFRINSVILILILITFLMIMIVYMVSEQLIQRLQDSRI